MERRGSRLSRRQFVVSAGVSSLGLLAACGRLPFPEKAPIPQPAQVPRIGVEPKSPDFLRLAESLGCHASRAASAEHLAQSVRDALVADRPTLIEVRQYSPWLITARAAVAPVSGR